MIVVLPSGIEERYQIMWKGSSRVGLAHCGVDFVRGRKAFVCCVCSAVLRAVVEPWIERVLAYFYGVLEWDLEWWVGFVFAALFFAVRLASGTMLPWSHHSA